MWGNDALIAGAVFYGMFLAVVLINNWIFRKENRISRERAARDGRAGFR